MTTVPQAEHWLARHAGAIMAVVMGLTFAYGVIAWANATTAQLNELTHRVSALEGGRTQVASELQVNSVRLGRIEQKVDDISAFLKGTPPQ